MCVEGIAIIKKKMSSSIYNLNFNFNKNKDGEGGGGLCSDTVKFSENLTILRIYL